MRIFSPALSGKPSEKVSPAPAAGYQDRDDQQALHALGGGGVDFQRGALQGLERGIEEPEEEGGEPVRDPRVFINPEIVEHSDHEVPYIEGCLSVPDQYAEVDRPDRIRARWLGLDGKARDEEITGLLATCLQHEMDHLDGILFIDHLSRLKREMILKKLAKQRKEQQQKAA